MSGIDDLLVRAEKNRRPPGGEAAPELRTAIVACMDARIEMRAVFDVAPGEVHVIRNAGGIVTDDVIRSLAVSQHKLGTKSVMVIQHTNCGMQSFTDAEFRAELLESAGSEPPWPPGSFSDLEANVRESVRRIVESPFMLCRDDVRGFIFEVDTGALTEVKR